MTKVARIWETLLTKYPKIDAAYFHNDDMALAAYKVMQAKGRTDIKIGGCDAMPPAIKAVQAGQMLCDRPQSVLPHSWRGDRRGRSGRAPGRQGRASRRTSSPTVPVVTKKNADGMLWMEEQFLI